VIRRWWCFSERLARLSRPARRRQGGGASIFQDLDLGEALSAEAEPRPTEGGGKGPPGGRIIGRSSAEDLKRREM
jgi:hypothetical protein